jgi:hypothetical protein
MYLGDLQIGEEGRSIPAIYLHKWRRLALRSDEESNKDALRKRWACGCDGEKEFVDGRYAMRIRDVAGRRRQRRLETFKRTTQV